VSYLPLVMLAVAIGLLLIGYPVAFTLGATAVGFGIAFLGIGFLDLLPLRIWGIMTNFTLLAVPLFVFMGVVLEKSGLAEKLLETMGLLFGRVRGGLAINPGGSFEDCNPPAQCLVITQQGCVFLLQGRIPVT